jgi:hypothetical protein
MIRSRRCRTPSFKEVSINKNGRHLCEVPAIFSCLQDRYGFAAGLTRADGDGFAGSQTSTAFCELNFGSLATVSPNFAR